MIDCSHYEHEEEDFKITDEMRERAKPDMEFLKNCGLPHTIEDAWVLQDLFDKAPLFIKAIRELAIAINEAWGKK